MKKNQFRIIAKINGKECRKICQQGDQVEVSSRLKRKENAPNKTRMLTNPN